MTITLDDVSNLLHLSIVGQFYAQQTLDSDSANDLLVESIRVDCGVAYEETRHCRGATMIHACRVFVVELHKHCNH